MPRGWDIIGVRREQKTASAPTKTRKKGNCSGMLLLIALFLGSLLFFGKLSQGNVTLPNPISSPKENETAQDGTPSIEVLNGSGRFEELGKVSSILTKAGHKVSKQETSLNSYDKTLVYYGPGFEEEATAIAGSLTDYQAKTQPFSNKSNYDIAVIIGSR